MTSNEQEVESARRRCRQSSDQLARQHVLIAKVRRLGLPTRQAEELLQILQEIQTEHEAYLNRVMKARPTEGFLLGAAGTKEQPKGPKASFCYSGTTNVPDDTLPVAAIETPLRATAPDDLADRVTGYAQQVSPDSIRMAYMKGRSDFSRWCTTMNVHDQLPGTLAVLVRPTVPVSRLAATRSRLHVKPAATIAANYPRRRKCLQAALRPFFISMTGSEIDATFPDCPRPIFFARWDLWAE